MKHKRTPDHIKIQVHSFARMAADLCRTCEEVAGEWPALKEIERVHQGLVADGRYWLSWYVTSIEIVALPGYCRTPADDAATTGAPGSCEAGCHYWQKCVNDDRGLPTLIPADDPARGGKPTCCHPKREAHWRVPMKANCFAHNFDWKENQTNESTSADGTAGPRAAVQLCF